jgi:3D (Asp-Asp-Asp) domain-containing protein
MKKSTFLGSAVSVLLLFSVISYSRSLIQQQNPKSQQQAMVASVPSAKEGTAASESSNSTPSTERPAEIAHDISTPAEKLASELYMATAYSLRGRTASGSAAATGMIAADPRVLPIGSRVRIEAGSYSGEYLVADTGGAVRGKRIDIWTPTAREAMRFGRRTVKLTVLQLGGKRGKTASAQPRTLTLAPTSVVPQTAKPQQ